MQWSPVQQLCFMKKTFFQSVAQYAKKTEKSKYVYSQQEWNLWRSGYQSRSSTTTKLQETVGPRGTKLRFKYNFQATEALFE